MLNRKLIPFWLGIKRKCDGLDSVFRELHFEILTKYMYASRKVSMF